MTLGNSWVTLRTLGLASRVQRDSIDHCAGRSVGLSVDRASRSCVSFFGVSQAVFASPLLHLHAIDAVVSGPCFNTICK